MTDIKYFLDSSIWLGYFFGNIPETREIIDSDTILYTSVLSLHEIFKKLLKLGYSEKKSLNAIYKIKDMSTISILGDAIAIDAVKNCSKYGLHTIDSLTYSSAGAEDAIFFTADKDFKGTKNTVIVKVPTRK